MTEDLKSGTRVRITLEGVAKGSWGVYTGSDEYDLGHLEIEDANERFYFENLPISAVEILKEPAPVYRNGLYYNGRPDASGDYGMRASLVLKHASGFWYDHRLNRIPNFDPAFHPHLRYMTVEGDK